MIDKTHKRFWKLFDRAASENRTAPPEYLPGLEVSPEVWLNTTPDNIIVVFCEPIRSS